MNIPGYDAWKLRGPDENAGSIMEACEECDGIGHCHDEDGQYSCHACNGTGEIETELDEPDADYLRDLRDDR